MASEPPRTFADIKDQVVEIITLMSVGLVGYPISSIALAAATIFVQAAHDSKMTPAMARQMLDALMALKGMRDAE